MNVLNVYNELTIGNRSPFNSRVLENYYFQASTQEAAYIFMYVIFNSRQLKKRRSYLRRQISLFLKTQGNICHAKYKDSKRRHCVLKINTF